MKQLFVVLMLLVVGSIAFGQGSNQNNIRFGATVTDLAVLTVNEAEATWEMLHPGVSYKCIADGANTTNIVPFNGDEAFTPGELVIEGAPGADIVVSFILPTTMLAIGGVGQITLDYDNQSCNWFDEDNGSNNFFNPMSPFTLTIPSGGSVLIYVGANPTVSPSTTANSEFEAYGIAVAEYTGAAL